MTRTRTITFHQPRHLAVGSGSFEDCAQGAIEMNPKQVRIICSPSALSTAEKLQARLVMSEIECAIDGSIDREPTISMFYEVLDRAKAQAPDCVVGIGGGSALDMAKLIAAFLHNSQRVEETFGINLLGGRTVGLLCVPTTAGTGSEVSPNAILLDETDSLKKGVVSPFLVPDASYIDPLLMVSMPPAVTAATGLDALTHCIEAYTNRFAHPLVDIYALEGIRKAAHSLPLAVVHPEDIEAREAMALASLYGGLCLGPVNTAAVHALAYPLGGEFHVAHGISNALLLPHVFEFNISASPERHADVAIALGAESAASSAETAQRGARRIREIAEQCGVRMNLEMYGIPNTKETVARMSKSAMTVTRLLQNNPRTMTAGDAAEIYRMAFRA